MIVNIDHINIVVSDLIETENFFKKLGFIRNHKEKIEGDWISEVVGLEGVSADYIALSLPESDVCVELIKYYSPVSPQTNLNEQANTIGFRHVALKVKDIEKEVKKLESLNIKFNSKIHRKGNKLLVYFSGPDDIIMELAEYL
ncbi:MAG: hypothetical protein GY750_08215 [Lentisphaerae bacterium]|nr:hypothetical protein [Lentisphaerota bacterium]MCP4101393.1 hypothetical protein [Lentisphaerota bacterium]